MATKWIPGSSIQQVGQISAAMAHDEWVNIDEHGRSTGQSFSPLWQNEGERRLGCPVGGVHLSQYSEYSGWSSERDINLTLKRQAFICLRDVRCSPHDCANSSKATYSRDTHCSVLLLLSGLRWFSNPIVKPWLKQCTQFTCALKRMCNLCYDRVMLNAKSMGNKNTKSWNRIIIISKIIFIKLTSNGKL